MPVAARQPLLPRALVLAALMAAAASLVAIAPAVADRDAGARLSASPSGKALGMSNSKNGVAVLTASGMLPGSSATGDVTLTNTGNVDADFALEKAGLVDQPGPNGGELSDALHLRVDDVTAPGASRAVYSGKLGAMGRVALGEFGERTARTYRFTVAMPDSGNAYQGSSVRLGYLWTASESSDDDGSGTGDVKGAAQSEGSGARSGGGDGARGATAGAADGSGDGSGAGGSLPFTGLAAGLVALAGVFLVACGAALRRRGGPRT
jgi:spore coat-associated protein N